MAVRNPLVMASGSFREMPLTDTLPGSIVYGASLGLPVLRPTLALDFANSQAMDPRVTFARASTATRVNQFGLLELVASGVPRFDYDPITRACMGLLLEEARTNLLLNSVIAGTSLATQSVTVTAAAHTLSFYGTGTVTLSGTSSGSLVGAGAYPTRSKLTFTPTAGSLTLTVTGSVQFANLELGSTASSFIPTAGATATRAVETAAMTGTNFSSWFNALEGAFVVHAGDLTAPVVNGYLISVDRNNGTAGAGRMQLTWSNSTDQAFAVLDDANSLVVSTSQTGSLSALAYKTNDYAQSTNGATVATDTSGTAPTGIIAMRLGVSPQGGSMLNGHIRSIAYYAKRLTDNELQALSTLAISVGRGAEMLPANQMLGTAATIDKEQLPVSAPVQAALNTKQDVLVSATNIKTINGTSVLGSGDLTVSSSNEIMWVREEQVATTQGGTPGATATWLTRTLNTTLVNTITGASRSGNEVTLPAGTYIFDGSAPAYRADSHKTRLYNVTDASVLMVGSSEGCSSDITSPAQTRSILHGVVTLAGTKAIRIEHIVATATTNSGFGRSAGGSVIETFSELLIRKL